MKVRSLFMLFVFVFVLMAEGVWAKSPAPTQVDGATTVSTKRAKILMNQGVIFIDVRRVTDFQTSRIQWAEHLDLKLDLTEESLLSVVKKNQPVVFYCNGDMCQRSAIASKKAVAWGWTKVFYYRGGFPDWKNAGLPLE
ncbi:adenylate cyclase [Bathymodiolus platifrons methanotrophic gill symbiont]|uniref:rhodanese-like domain-containing protein n=1 Tax=Bathymodiolus platifrons methanotrophic gill symbiont TaxID=113268 RepID=UPI001B64A356|nr:rhodanese-like domain-containing protein [Bathymodiolus platifrons methanotrophic gill symbiont]GFO75335.1 adenylate cyclase [Bathymodiolus platifrons methanotrophic gill symbiont]